MQIQRNNQVSRAHRWAYAGGKAVKRAIRKLRVFEMRMAERAAVGRVPAGKLLVRGGFLAAKLVAVGVLLYISFWLFVFVCTISALAILQSDRDGDSPDIDDLYSPTHRTAWPERYDKWGSLK